MDDDRMTQFMKEFQENTMRDQTIARAEREQRAAKEARAELRDRFAMAALIGLVGNSARYRPNPVSAKEAWDWADMMLATRGDDHEPKGEQR
jgi:hypothetical protein